MSGADAVGFGDPFDERDVLNSSPMFSEYLNQLKDLWLRPSDFFEKTVKKGDDKLASRFVVRTSLLVALELGFSEALGGGDLRIIAFVTLVLVLVMPFVLSLWVLLWSLFIRLCAQLLGETLPLDKVRLIVSYSAGGWVTLVLGFGWGLLFSMIMVFFQAVGFEKVLGYSRWNSRIYAGFPFALLAMLILIFTLLFKVFK